MNYNLKDTFLASELILDKIYQDIVNTSANEIHQILIRDKKYLTLENDVSIKLIARKKASEDHKKTMLIAKNKRTHLGLNSFILSKEEKDSGRFYVKARDTEIKARRVAESYQDKFIELFANWDEIPDYLHKYLGCDALDMVEYYDTSYSPDHYYALRSAIRLLFQKRCI